MSRVLVKCIVCLALALTVGAQASSLVGPPAGQQPASQQVSPLQAQLNAMQVQAQRQLGQLNGLMLNAASNLTGIQPATINSNNLNGQRMVSNVLETLSNVGKAIQQQLSASNNHVHIVTSSSSSSPTAAASEPANSKKNEYQSIVITDTGSSLVPASAPTNQSAINYREQGEQLRQDIVRRAGQLQQVVAGSMELMKNNGDLIMRRLLEQMNSRLDQAKAKADRIINEPATNEMAVKALSTINLGLNNLNTIISNIVSRLDLAAKEGGPQRAANPNGQPQLVVPPLLDTTKFRANLHQIGQQFQSAFNGSQLHQQLIRQRQLLLLSQPPAAGQQQQQQPSVVDTQGASNKINTDFQQQQRAQNR